MSQMTRALGIDFGLSRIGLALSDPQRILASALETINWDGRDWEWALGRIVEHCRKNDIGLIVLGLPRRTDGKASDSEQKTREFADCLLERSALPVVFEDERYTTVLAGRILGKSAVRKTNRRAVIDQVAAEIILQSYLDNHRTAPMV